MQQPVTKSNNQHHRCAERRFQWISPGEDPSSLSHHHVDGVKEAEGACRYGTQRA